MADADAFQCPRCGRVSGTQTVCLGTRSEPHAATKMRKARKRELREALDLGGEGD